MLKEHENLTMAISTVVLGVVVGAGSLCLGLFLNVIERLFLSFNENEFHPYSWLVSPTHRLLSVFIGGIIAAIVWWLMRTRMRPTVSLAKGVDGEDMPVWTTIVHVMTQIFYVATGGSVGRELAPRELGAMISQTWQRFLKRVYKVELTEDDRRLLVAAAAGAGFAGVYIAPITGALFCLEILYKKITKRAVMVSLTMSVIAMLMGAILKGFRPYYAVGTGNFTLKSVVLVLVIGPISGLAGAYFRKGFKWAGAKQTRNNNLLWQLPLMGLITGLIAMHYPEIMGNGRALAQTALDNKSASLIWIFLLGALAKALVTTFTLRAGAAGGTLTPSISVGAVIGTAIGFCASLFVPGVSIWQCGVLGASSLLASSQQAPLMALFMLFEVSHLNYSALLPLAIGVSLAMLVSTWVLKPAKD